MASRGCGFTSLQHCQVLSHRDFSTGGRCNDRQLWRQEPSVRHSQNAMKFPHFLVLPGEWERGEPDSTASRALQCTNLLQIGCKKIRFLEILKESVLRVSRKEQTSHPWPQLRVTSASEHRAVHSLTASLRTCLTWKSNPNSSSLETAWH